MTDELDADDTDLLSSLEGRTITRTLYQDDNDGEWGHHGQFWLWLDDGRVIEFSSYGYDADGPTIGETEVVDIAACHHCGNPHPDSEVLRRQNGKGYCYCTNGNNLSTVPDLPTKELTS